MLHSRMIIDKHKGYTLLYYILIWLERMRKTSVIKTNPIQGLNWVPPNYKSDMLLLRKPAQQQDLIFLFQP